ncbi:MAG TPA: ABC transporter permease [Euzebyales bacterium]|nr:ABC transporter permease [Euzebyales bacterium]
MRRSFADRFLGGYALAVYAFLFAPILVVVVFSFNAGRHVAELTGLSLRWYEEAWTNQFVLRAFRTSLGIATVSATIATVLGTSSALAMQAVGRRTRAVYQQLSAVAIVVPGIVIGISTLIFFVMFFDWANAWFAYLWPTATPPRLGLGAHTVIGAHSLFTMAIVNVLVRTRLAGMDRSLVEASEDLYATPVRTLFQVTLPQLQPAIIAGFLLAFTFSFDDFIVAFFTRGQAQTLPIFLFASIRRGVTPVVNAVASVLLVVTVSLLSTAWYVLERRGRRLASTVAQVATEPASEAAA